MPEGRGPEWESVAIHFVAPEDPLLPGHLGRCCSYIHRLTLLPGPHRQYLAIPGRLKHQSVIVYVSYWMAKHVWLTHGNQKRRKSSGHFGSNHEVARKFGA